MGRCGEHKNYLSKENLKVTVPLRSRSRVNSAVENRLSSDVSTVCL